MKTEIYIKHIYGTPGQEEFLKKSLQQDPVVLRADCVQYKEGCYSMLVTGVKSDD